MDRIYEALCRMVGSSQVRCAEPMRLHTTFRIGGPADYFVTPMTKEELQDIVIFCEKEEVPWYILGNGSNLLVADKGIRGVVISLEKGWNTVQVVGNCVEAGAGALLSRVAKAAAAEELTGLEFAAGIPGSVGGALVMNAGAYGGEMKDVLRDAEILTRDGEILRMSAADLELGYRTSCIPKKQYLVLQAVFELKRGDKEAIYARMEELANARREKQPLEYPSAGSTFKRPQGYFAAKLIDDAGLRGLTVGDAQVSEKHCGFVVNKGQATADDVQKLCEKVQRTVYEKFGVSLEMEVKQVGDFHAW